MPYFKDSENKLHWLDKGDNPADWLPHCTKITDQEAQLIIAANQAAMEASITYAQKRIAEYPSVGEQLDALFKAGLFPTEMAKKIQSVKDKYPKE